MILAHGRSGRRRAHGCARHRAGAGTPSLRRRPSAAGPCGRAAYGGQGGVVGPEVVDERGSQGVGRNLRDRQGHGHLRHARSVFGGVGGRRVDEVAESSDFDERKRGAWMSTTSSSD